MKFHLTKPKKKKILRIITGTIHNLYINNSYLVFKKRKTVSKKRRKKSTENFPSAFTAAGAKRSETVAHTKSEILLDASRNERACTEARGRLQPERRR